MSAADAVWRIYNFSNSVKSRIIDFIFRVIAHFSVKWKHSGSLLIVLENISSRVKLSSNSLDGKDPKNDFAWPIWSVPEVLHLKLLTPSLRQKGPLIVSKKFPHNDSVPRTSYWNISLNDMTRKPNKTHT